MKRRITRLVTLLLMLAEMYYRQRDYLEAAARVNTLPVGGARGGILRRHRP
jgi:hypothetical protein